MAVLVTGATGFIGRHLTLRLLSDGETVRVLTRNPEKLPSEWSGKVEVITGNLLNQHDCQVATAGACTVFHLAGEIEKSELMTAVNTGATRALVESADSAGVKRFVHLSSVGVVGARGNAVITEDTPCQPQNEYEQTKFAGEQSVREYSAGHRIEAVVLRPTIVFGEYQTRQRDSLLSWLRAVQQDRFFFIDRSAIANYVYAGDVAEAMVQLSRLPMATNEIVNIADPAPMLDFVNTMSETLGIPPPTRSVPRWFAFAAATALEGANYLVKVPAPLTRARVRALSSKCLYSGDKSQRMGIKLPFGYKTGLVRTVDWYRQMGKL